MLLEFPKLLDSCSGFTLLVHTKNKALRLPIMVMILFATPKIRLYNKNNLNLLMEEANQLEVSVVLQHPDHMIDMNY